MPKIQSIIIDENTITSDEPINKRELLSIIENYSLITNYEKIKEGTNIIIFKLTSKQNYLLEGRGKFMEYENKKIKYYTSDLSYLKTALTENSIILKEMTIDDLKKEFRDEMFKKDQEIMELSLMIKKQEKEIEKLKKKLSL